LPPVHGAIICAVALLHKDEPVTDASVNCPQCRAIDWVVRTPRFGGDASIVCRACGHEHGPYFEIQPAGDAELPEVDLAAAAFPVYVPRSLPWEPADYFADGHIASATVACDEPWLVVTTEPLTTGTEPAEALRDALMDALPDDEPSRSGRSTAAWLLEIDQLDARLEAEVADLSVETAVLRADGRDVPCQVLRRGSAWAAYAALDEVAVIASSTELPLADVALERTGREQR
jgi:hypothetical protein